MTRASFDRPLRLEPLYRDYVWGGRRLRPQVPGPTAEAWIVDENNRVLDGPHSGKLLKDVAATHSAALLGSAAPGEGGRFPLLIKLLDSADWLSVQVHPDDAQARALEGPDHNGKTEAWYVLHADPGAQLLVGTRLGTTREDIRRAIRGREILDYTQQREVQRGECLLMPAGTLHAIGPGLMIYEVQQRSDLTYRVYDWDRPASPSRPLHTEKSLAVIDPSTQPRFVPKSEQRPGSRATLVQCAYFRLQRVDAGPAGLAMDTHGQTFHALTCIGEQARLSGAGWEVGLAQWETVLIPAALGAYQVQSDQPARLLCASLV